MVECGEDGRPVAAVGGRNFGGAVAIVRSTPAVAGTRGGSDIRDGLRSRGAQVSSGGFRRAGQLRPVARGLPDLRRWNVHRHPGKCRLLCWAWTPSRSCCRSSTSWPPDADALPAIAVVRLPSGLTHFVVLWRRVGSYVQVMDPARGRRWVRASDLMKDLYVHAQAVDADAFRAFAVDPGFTGPLAWRLGRLMGSSRAAALAPLVTQATADPSWRPIARLDGAARAAESLIESGVLRRGAEAERLVRAMLGGVSDAFPDASLPVFDGILDAYACARARSPGSQEPEQEQVLMHGAVLVRIAGRRIPDAEHPAGPLPVDLAGALTEKPVLLWRTLTALWSASARSWVIVLAVLALMAALGTIAEVRSGAPVVDGQQRRCRGPRWPSRIRGFDRGGVGPLRFGAAAGARNSHARPCARSGIAAGVLAQAAATWRSLFRQPAGVGHGRTGPFASPRPFASRAGGSTGAIAVRVGLHDHCDRLALSAGRSGRVRSVGGGVRPAAAGRAGAGRAGPAPANPLWIVDALLSRRAVGAKRGADTRGRAGGGARARRAAGRMEAGGTRSDSHRADRRITGRAAGGAGGRGVGRRILGRRARWHRRGRGPRCCCCSSCLAYLRRRRD